MAKVKVYNQAGQEVRELELDPKFFEIESNSDLIHQVVIAQAANSRQVLAHTKDRSEVRGGGKKPWRQKGTGRARHGSIRSPLWIGGGVTFGPTKDRNFSQKINKKMKRKALMMCLSDKVKSNDLVVIDKIDSEEIKTKKMAEMLKKLPLKNKVLLVLPESDLNIIRSINNIPRVKTIRADSLNVIDVLDYKSLLVAEPSIKKIEEFYS